MWLSREYSLQRDELPKQGSAVDYSRLGPLIPNVGSTPGTRMRRGNSSASTSASGGQAQPVLTGPQPQKLPFPPYDAHV